MRGLDVSELSSGTSKSLQYGISLHSHKTSILRCLNLLGRVVRIKANYIYLFHSNLASKTLHKASSRSTRTLGYTGAESQSQKPNAYFVLFLERVKGYSCSLHCW